MKYGIYILVIFFLFLSCGDNIEHKSGKINIVTTTTIVTDLVKNIGGEKVNVLGLMGAGVDPHLYKASAGDISKLSNAEIIFYGGLHLEGKLASIFEQMEQQNTLTVNLGNTIDKSKLHLSENFGGNYDPHIWFDVSLVKEEVKEICDVLTDFDPKNENYYKNNLENYLIQLDTLENQIKAMISTLPESKRKLVTAHDAFGYFGSAYDFEVLGLQGISTVTEAGTQDIRRVTDYIVEYNIKSIFVESSVPKRTVEALQQNIQQRNRQVEIGGMLYSDALGSPNTAEGTYTGMFYYNVKTIVEGLK